MTSSSRPSLDLTGRRVHFIGIGGAGMRALAIVTHQMGAIVTGSDLAATPDTDGLEAMGIPVAIGQRPENLPVDCDLVIVSAAVPEENSEYAAARNAGRRILSYARMLGRLMGMRRGIAVAGTHGKSSTSAMIAYALRQCGADPSFVVGADVPQLGSPSGAGDGEWLVAEACEYARNFLELRPEIAIINNIEADHLDYYGDLAGVIRGFGEFISLVPPTGRLIVNGEDENVATAIGDRTDGVETFGFADGLTWRAVVRDYQDGRGRFTLLKDGEPAAEVALAIPGEHQVLNAAAAIAACVAAGVPAQSAADALGGFQGADRRMSVRYRDENFVVIDDYAHHPTEIATTLKAARDCFHPKRLICIFQPHQASRTIRLMDRFAGCFSEADRLIICDIYSVRDSREDRDAVSAADLADRVLNSGSVAKTQSADLAEAAEIVQRELRSGDVVLTLGAGDVYKVSDELVRWLGKNR